MSDVQMSPKETSAITCGCYTNGSRMAHDFARYGNALQGRIGKDRADLAEGRQAQACSGRLLVLAPELPERRSLSLQALLLVPELLAAVTPAVPAPNCHRLGNISAA